MQNILDKIMTVPNIANYLSRPSNNFHDEILKNEEDKNLIFSWINQNIVKLNAKLVYSAKINGDDSFTFHNLCDNIGPSLIIIESEHGHIFGGYTSASWKGNKIYKTDKNAFIFSLTKKKKLNLIQESYSIYFSP